MGVGIAQVFAASGYHVALTDPNAEAMNAALERINGIFKLLDQDSSSIENISLHAVLEDAVASADFVFEAAPERLDLKQSIFSDLVELTDGTVILASNTSGIPITQIAEKSAAPERIVGTHFWNPPHLIPLVEVIQGDKTNQDVVSATINLLTDVGKTAVHVKKDIPGFIGNRLQHALKREAIALVENGVCDAETVDLVVKEGFGMRLAVMGPLENSDLVGLNLTLDIHDVLLPYLNNASQPQKLLRDKVAAGELGMTVGQGFRKWTTEEAEEARRTLNEHLVQCAKSRAKSLSN